MEPGTAGSRSVPAAHATPVPEPCQIGEVEPGNGGERRRRSRLAAGRKARRSAHRWSTELPSWGSQMVIISGSSATSRRGRDRVRFGAIPAQIGYKPRHPTPANDNQYQPTFPRLTGHLDHQSPGRRPPSGATSPNAARPKQSVPSPGGQISGMTGHQRGWAGGRVWTGWGIPPTSPRATTWGPEGRAHKDTAGRVEGCPRVPTWSGYARLTGCPTAPSVQDHPWSSSGGNASRPPTRQRTSQHGRSAKRSGRQT